MELTPARMESPDWSKLPEDVLLLIYQHLRIGDLLRSAKVCTTWHTAFVNFRRFGLPIIPDAPWLVALDQNAFTKLYCFNVEADRMNLCAVPSRSPAGGAASDLGGGCCFTYDNRDDFLVGCSQGWLIIADKRSDLYFLNPVTGAPIERRPPPSATLDYVEAFYDEQGSLQSYRITRGGYRHHRHAPSMLRYSCFSQAVLSSTPSDEHHSIMACSRDHKRLAFAQAGDESWTTKASDGIFNEIVFHNSEFYVLVNYERIQVFDLNGRHKSWIRVPGPRPGRAYVVVAGSPAGGDELLLEVRSVFGDDSSCGIHRVRELRTGKELESLGSRAIFIGRYSSMCISCSEFPELRPNSIYYIKEGRRIGVYSLEDGGDHDILPSDDQDRFKMFEDPTWFIPSLY